MKISVKEINRITRLAQLPIEESEKKILSRQLNDIISFFDKLKEVDTTNIEPISHPHDITNVMRKDKIKKSLPVDKALENAPAKSSHYFKVPKVITK